MGTLAAVDLISLRGGGCALNTSSALGRLGLHTAVVGKVGADPFGDFLLGLLEQRSVDAAGVRRDPTLPTSASVVCVDTAGESTFLHLTGANAGLRADEIGDGVFHCRALHLAGALVLDALDGEPAAALLAEAQLRGIHTSLDTAFDPSGRWERVLPSLPHCHLVTPDLNEAQAVTGEEEPARRATHARARCNRSCGDARARRLLPRLRALRRTCARVHRSDARRHRAGDAFAAGLLHARLAGWPLERAARFANAAGALATTAVGAFEGVGDLAATLDLAEANT